MSSYRISRWINEARKTEPACNGIKKYDKKISQNFVSEPKVILLAWGFVWVSLVRFFFLFVCVCVFFSFLIAISSVLWWVFWGVGVFFCLVWCDFFGLVGFFSCGKWCRLSTWAHFLKPRLMFIFCCAVGWNCFTVDRQSVHKLKKGRAPWSEWAASQTCTKLCRHYPQVGCCRGLDIYSNAF